MDEPRFSVGPFQVTFDDYMTVVRAIKVGAFHRSYLWVAYLLATGAVGVLIWLALALVYRAAVGPLPANFGVLAFFAATIGAAAIMQGVGRTMYKQVFAGTLESGAACSVSLGDEGVRYAMGKVEIAVPWANVERLLERGDCILFFIDDSDSVTVPKRAFASHADAAAFWAFARERWTMARGELREV